MRMGWDGDCTFFLHESEKIEYRGSDIPCILDIPRPRHSNESVVFHRLPLMHPGSMAENGLVCQMHVVDIKVTAMHMQTLSST
jgi:hypothetical protein